MLEIILIVLLLLTLVTSVYGYRIFVRFAPQATKDWMLSEAILDINKNKVELLLQNGANPNHYTCHTMLDYATYKHKGPNPESNSNLAIMKLLLKHGADINGTMPALGNPTKRSSTPLFTAIATQNKNRTKFLLKKGADWTIVSDSGYTAYTGETTPENLAAHLFKRNLASPFYSMITLFKDKKAVKIAAHVIAQGVRDKESVFSRFYGINELGIYIASLVRDHNLLEDKAVTIAQRNYKRP